LDSSKDTGECIRATPTKKKKGENNKRAGLLFLLLLANALVLQLIQTHIGQAIGDIFKRERKIQAAIFFSFPCCVFSCCVRVRFKS
jgi:hypothetical protein